MITVIVCDDIRLVRAVVRALTARSRVELGTRSTTVTNKINMINDKINMKIVFLKKMTWLFQLQCKNNLFYYIE